MKTFTITVLFLLTGVVSAAYADCIYNGTNYPTGTQVGPYVCMPDGSWERR